MTIELKINNVFDELNLYLTSNKLKPASIIDLDVYISVDSKEKLNEEISNLELRINKFFKNQNVVYSIKNYYKLKENFEEKSDEGVYHKRLEFYVAKDYFSLKRLLRARSDEEKGIALGYPMKSVIYFSKNIDGEVRNWNYFVVSIAKAKKAGIEIPRWLAYISFIPDNLDFLNKNVSYEARILGKKYRRFVKKNNPELAKRVEECFFSMVLPDSWEKDSEGNYVLCYKINDGCFKI
ncbi:MAG: hypothetical protein QXU20_01250 [Candidatus Woesearchaeota archaeon]